ncbi:TPA: citrate:sodium symporter, partial [Klebsiella pneumoniae]
MYLLLCAGLTTPSINRITFMTNMSQAPATEKKGVSDLLGFKIFGMPLPLYA